LGTITNLETAVQWLRGTFLFVRYQKNPQHYRLPDVDGQFHGDGVLEVLCRNQISLLQNYELVASSGSLRSTLYGESAAQYSVRIETARRFLTLPSQAKLSEIVSCQKSIKGESNISQLTVIGQAEELKDFKFRSGEKGAYKELNKSTRIRFQIPVNLDLPAHKVSLLIQCVLAGETLPVKGDEQSLLRQFQQDQGVIFSHIKRLIRCIADFQIHREDSISLRNALLLCRSFYAQAWDDTAVQLKQIANIGVVSVRKLSMAGISTLEILEQTEPHKIEMVLGRAPPFGRQILDIMKGLPKVRVGIKAVGKPVMSLTLSQLAADLSKGYPIWKGRRTKLDS
jgi:ATP-dependent DNA helicase HFM1/MER3